MFKGFVLSESLQDPTLLNTFEKIYVKVELHSESDEYPPFWHLFKIRVGDEEIKKVSDQFANSIKPKWYAHFWNDKTVYVVFSNKIFQIPMEEEWSSKEFQETKEYALSVGIAERYLDFKIEDRD
ncbi:hypothetical protein ACFL0V_01155 [Nanoarchaeota archaeon]